VGITIGGKTQNIGTVDNPTIVPDGHGDDARIWREGTELHVDAGSGSGDFVQVDRLGNRNLVNLNDSPGALIELSDEDVRNLVIHGVGEDVLHVGEGVKGTVGHRDPEGDDQIDASRNTSVETTTDGGRRRTDGGRPFEASVTFGPNGDARGLPKELGSMSLQNGVLQIEGTEGDDEMIVGPANFDGKFNVSFRDQDGRDRAFEIGAGFGRLHTIAVHGLGGNDGIQVLTKMDPELWKLGHRTAQANPLGDFRVDIDPGKGKDDVIVDQPGGVSVRTGDGERDRVLNRNEAPIQPVDPDGQDVFLKP
jgi:hypothetical protein